MPKINGEGTADVSRRLGPFTATAIVVANMIGAGIFTTSGIMAAHLPGPSWVLACWLLGGTIAVAGALCYGELATRMPLEGGEYVYLHRLYHPALGFLTGWTSLFIGFSAPIAGSALGFAAYLFAGLGGDALPEIVSSTVPLQKAAAVAVIVLFTLLHYHGLRVGGGVQNVLTVVKVLLISGLAAAGLIVGRGSWSNLSPPARAPSEGIAVGTSMILVMFAYSGWNASAYISGEIKNPRRTLPASLVTGTAIVILLYLAINLFIFHAVPFAELQGSITVVEKASSSAFGVRTGKSLGLVVAFALLSSLSAFIMIGPRVYFAMARDRLFLPFAARVHPKYRVPGRSVLVQGAIAVVMVLVGSFEQLLIYIGFALQLFPFLAVAGLFIARKRRIGEDSAVRVWGFPVVPGFFLAASLTLMILTYINRPLESSVAVLTVLAGIPCYFLWIKRIVRTGAR